MLPPHISFAAFDRTSPVALFVPTPSVYDTPTWNFVNTLPVVVSPAASRERRCLTAGGKWLGWRARLARQPPIDEWLR